jgi:LmbE family N-acetylglucosaminyl deacetylase
MKYSSVLLSFAALLFCGSIFLAKPVQAQEDRPLRIIAIFAHPDDAEAKMGGTTALWAEMGHEVKFVSLTNGDHGHHEIGGGPLANRRREESYEAARRLGVKEYVIFDNHDSQLLPHLHIRQDVIREIRKWNADIVLGLRTNDYHPDHRYAGVLVMDAAYMVIVPNVTPDTPPLTQNPVFLYMHDRFQRPYPFQNDIVVAIDNVIDKKIDGLDAHLSQMYEWLPWVAGTLGDVPEDPAERRAWLSQRWIRPNVTAAHMPALEKFYGPEVARRIQFVEGFEIAEYGRQPSDEEIRRLFPMLGNF